MICAPGDACIIGQLRAHGGVYPLNLGLNVAHALFEARVCRIVHARLRQADMIAPRQVLDTVFLPSEHLHHAMKLQGKAAGQVRVYLRPAEARLHLRSQGHGDRVGGIDENELALSLFRLGVEMTRHERREIHLGLQHLDEIFL